MSDQPMSSDAETPRPEAQMKADELERLAKFWNTAKFTAESLRAGAQALRELPALQQQLTAQQETIVELRAELTGTLSEAFKAIPECYDTPADHYREMARRLVEDRDVLKHRCRALEAGAEEQLALKNAHLVRANEVGRAQAIAQVKALLERKQRLFEPNEGAFNALGQLLEDLDAKPDSSLAVLSAADREQALQLATGVWRQSPTAAADMAEARVLLHLPQEPTR